MMRLKIKNLNRH